MINQALILVGGKGSRLRQCTITEPLLYILTTNHSFNIFN